MFLKVTVDPKEFIEWLSGDILTISVKEGIQVSPERYEGFWVH